MKKCVTRFFKTIFAKTTWLVELRCLPSGQRIFSRDHRKLLLFIKAHFDENVYFGVATRWLRAGSKQACAEIPALWIDMDWKEFIGGRKAAAELLKQFPMEPSIIVNSGHGYHVFWLLKRPVAARLDVEAYLKGLASALNGDRAAAEVARILRVPGTFNFKGPEEVPVKCIKLTHRRYRLSDFKAWKNSENRRPVRTPTFSTDNIDITLDKFKLTKRIRMLIESGWTGTPYKSRSEADMAVITALVKARAAADEIRAIFRKFPIGEKYREKGLRGDGYLSGSIGNAAAFLAAAKGRGAK
jgi:putative DNA primase/helicase